MKYIHKPDGGCMTVCGLRFGRRVRIEDFHIANRGSTNCPTCLKVLYLREQWIEMMRQYKCEPPPHIKPAKMKLYGRINKRSVQKHYENMYVPPA